MLLKAKNRQKSTYKSSKENKSSETFLIEIKFP